MAESDDEYVQDISDDEAEAHQVTRGDGSGTRGASNQRMRGGSGWEVTRTWENIVEGADGTITSTVEDLLEARKRKRTLKDTTPLQRGIIRHLIMSVDLSGTMAEKDYHPTRYQLMLRCAQEFVTEFFEQNPISQLGIIGMRDGLAVRISDMSGNPNDHIGPLQALKPQEPKGHASLQNALDMARAALFHAPSHGTREVLVLFGSLLTSDPGDIHTTINALVSSQISCTVIGLAAQVAICHTLVKRTNPGLNPDDSYGVGLDEKHYRDLVMQMTTPPVITRKGKADEEGGDAEDSKGSLLMMGFPSRMMEEGMSLCACHSKPTQGGYLCSRCGSKVCVLPSTCPACGLTLILSTHLARSYHHLFPLKNWDEVSWKQVSLLLEKSKEGKEEFQRQCFGCTSAFVDMPPPEQWKGTRGGVSESGRYECGTCGRHFCSDCDVFSHEVVHNCPGCQSYEGVLGAGGGKSGQAVSGEEAVSSGEEASSEEEVSGDDEMDIG